MGLISGNSTRAVRILRRAGLLTLLLLVIILTPYFIARLGHAENAVILTHLDQESSKKYDSSLKIGCFNIAHGRGAKPGGPNKTDEPKADRLARLQQIGELIASEKLDLVVLNEVDFDCNWSHNVDQAELIAKAAGLPFILKQRNSDIRFPFYTLRFGNAVLSRYPLSEPNFLKLPVLKQWEDLLGGAHHTATCLVTLPDSCQIQIIPVHLEVRSEETRIAGVEQIAQTVTRAKEKNIPSFVLGDFNSYPTQEVKNAIEVFIEKSDLHPAGGINLTPDKFTFPSKKPDRRLDWIFLPPEWKATSHYVIPAPLSDHCLIVSDFSNPTNHSKPPQGR